jgi:cysteine desulfurase/selenocysteine lyase
MGYLTEETALWERYADQFPVTERLIYLNHAAVAPLVKRAADAMKRLADEACEYGSLHYAGWLETYAGLREAAARLVGASAAEIAIVKNTSEGIATVANGLDWRPGDRVVAFREEFPANYFPWVRLERRGVQVRWLSVADPLEAVDAACRGARLLAISHVNYLSGHRVDLEAIGEICHRHGCLFFVDAIQGLGVFPLDVRRARIDALAADGHKWLLGPEGCGVLYVRRELQDAIEPVEFGWTNVAHYADYASRDMTLRPDAGRYECGTLNTIGCFGLRAAIEFLLEVGVEAIQGAVLALTARLVEGARAKGYEVLGPADERRRSGIVSIRKEGLDSRDRGVGPPAKREGHHGLLPRGA